MDATNNIATDLFYKIRSRFKGLKLGDAAGSITINPEEARFFDFDYNEGDKNNGHVSISLAEANSMKVYFSNGITEGMDDPQKDNWYGFLKELRKFSKRRLLAFDTRDIAKDNLDQRDYAFLSQYSNPQADNDTIVKPVGENKMNESTLYGTKKQSFQKLEDTRLIIKHSKKLADDTEMKPGDRSRNIAALFVENQEGSPNLPGVWAKIKRPRAVTVSYIDKNGNQIERDFVGLWAVSVQHQIDHLNGKMFFDHLSNVRRKMLINKSQKLSKQGLK